jgi:3-oxoacyl-[acyl-carrier protein] reductase
MSQRLANKIALITGSSRGIGRAAALAFAREGGAFDWRALHRQRGCGQCHRPRHRGAWCQGGRCEGDLRHGKDAADSLWAQFGEAARSETGSSALDILVNNAGIAPALPLKQTSEAAFDEVMTINYKAPFFLIQAVADHIRDNGRVINVSTGFTRIAAPTHPAYAASKGALETLTLALAPEFAARGITVNAVLPGVTETDMNAEWLASPDARAGAEALSVFSRVGKAEDVADVIAFLASNDARWTTGQMIDATGGARI